MKKLLLLLAFASTLVIVVFLSFPGFEQKILTLLNSPGKRWTYASLSGLVLSSDIFLPIPSSPIMMLNGRILGVVFGSLLSLVAGMVSSFIGYHVGRRSRTWIKKFFTDEETSKSDQLIRKWGYGAISISRAVPILAESVAVVAGTSLMPIKQFLLYSFVGQAVISVTYALIGNINMRYDSSLSTVVVICLVLSFTWILNIFLTKYGANDFDKSA